MPLSGEQEAHLRPWVHRWADSLQNTEPLSQKEWEQEKKQETVQNCSALVSWLHFKAKPGGAVCGYHRTEPSPVLSLQSQKISQIYFPEVAVLQLREQKQIIAFLGYKILSDKDAASYLQMAL